MGEKQKKPQRFLVIIPLTVLADILILCITEYLDTTRVPEPESLIKDIPIYTVSTMIYLIVPNIAAFLTAILLTVCACIKRKRQTAAEPSKE